MSDDPSVLRALASLKTEIESLLNQVHNSLQVSISKLQEDHARALLEQERRNSQFADRDRVEDVARNVHTLASSVTTNQLRIAKLETADSELRACIEKVRVDLSSEISGLSKTICERSFVLWGSTTGYLVTALLMVCVSVLTYVLTHLGHV